VFDADGKAFRAGNVSRQGSHACMQGRTTGNSREFLKECGAEGKTAWKPDYSEGNQEHYSSKTRIQNAEKKAERINRNQREKPITN